MLQLANIIASACKQVIFRLELFATNIPLRLKLFANKLKLVATSLQSYSLAQISCNYQILMNRNVRSVKLAIRLPTFVRVVHECVADQAAREITTESRQVWH